MGEFFIWSGFVRRRLTSQKERAVKATIHLLLEITPKLGGEYCARCPSPSSLWQHLHWRNLTRSRGRDIPLSLW